MLARRQRILLCPGSSDTTSGAVDDGSHIKARWLRGRENIMLRPLRWQQNSYRSCDLAKGAIARCISRQWVIGGMRLVLVLEPGCPCMAVEMIKGESFQVLLLRLGRAGIVKHLAIGQVDVAGNGKLVTKKVGGSLIGLKKLPRPIQ